MKALCRRRQLLVLALGLWLLVPVATAQSGAGDPAQAPGGAQGSPANPPGTQQAPGRSQIGGPNPGVDREKMWPAPTAEDWKKPCLVEWQRTWDDALAVAQGTGKPILICVNMDGEIASEHYAGVRYREVEIAPLYEPYVCVIASVYRHNPRDYDEEGRRVLCPRFGSVTCGEHIAIEPGLYEQFFDGKRIAPRHIGVELEQGRAEMYDVYYAWDTDSIFNALKAGIANRPSPAPIVRGDRPLLERVASRDIQDRTQVERAYQRGDRTVRRSLLEAALVHHDLDQVDLLRLALFGFDVELARLARRALAESTSEKAIDLIVEALRVPMEASERDLLIAALERLGQEFPRAQTLAVVQQGLSTRSSALDLENWSRGLAGAEYPAPGDWVALASRVESGAKTSSARPADPEASVELAEAALALAVDPETAQILAADARTASAYSRLQFEDARRVALEAERLGASGWRVNAVLGLAAYYLGDSQEAHRRAEAALATLSSGEASWNAMGVLALFAEARQQAILEAVRAKTPWPAQWLADVNAAYSVLARHPQGTDFQVAGHHDFLRRLGAAGRAAEVLDEGLARFPDSWGLHERLRMRILEEHGIDGLEPAYEVMLHKPDASKNLEWFAGYAALVAAEFHRRAGEAGPALAAYDRAIAHYERGSEQNPESRASADHYVAVALAGRARLAFERGDDERAVSELLASFERKPESAAALDGLNLSAVDTAKMLRARLAEAKKGDLVAKLQAALDKLDPKLLELPAYERDVPGANPTRPRRARTQTGE